jgi:hypothetical protein
LLFAEPPAGRRFRHLPLAGLPPATLDAMLGLAAASCKHLDIEDYLSRRFALYDSAVLWGSDRELSAFLFVNEFSEAGARFVYLGPLFSRGRACVDLFVSFARLVLRQHEACVVHFAAEFQSPEAMLLFKRLFFRTSLPSFRDDGAEPHLAPVLAAYARRLPHVGAVDLASCSTRSVSPSLFRPSPDFEPVVRWLAGRGIDFSRGDSQVLVTTCEPSAGGRLRTWRDMRDGVRALSDWDTTRRRMLQWIEELPR